MLVVILVSLCHAASEIKEFSFRSPFLPDHSEKFRTVGDAIPLRKFIRLGPPRQNTKGGIISAIPLNLSSFEIQTIINSAGDSPNENIGLSLWLSEKPEPLGRIYGLSPSYRGLSLFIDVAKHRMYVSEILDDLTVDKVLISENCPIEVKNRQTSVHVHFTGSEFEVWIKDRRMRKCATIKTKQYGEVYFGISSFSGNNTSTVFDIFEILTTELEDEENENDAIKELELNLMNELKILEGNLIELEFRVRGIKNSREYTNIFSNIQILTNRLQALYIKVSDLRITLKNIHLDQKFTELSNNEISFIKEKFSFIHVKIETLMGFLNSNKIYDDFTKTLTSHFTQTNSQGELLKSELASADKRLAKFQDLLKLDSRISYLNFLFFILACCLGVLFFRILKIDKFRTIT